jgi:hypothetical protein
LAHNENYGSSRVFVFDRTHSTDVPSSCHLSHGRQRFPFPKHLRGIDVGWIWHAHQNVYGLADDGGIRYKRYFKWEFVNWGEIESISRRPMGAISVDVGRYKFFNRRLVFMPDIVLFGEQRNFVSFDNLRSAWIRAQQLRAEPSGESLESRTDLV